MKPHLGDEVRRALHPEAPMPYEPRRPVGRGELPKGCDQQGRYPQAAEPCIDEDELGIKLPEPEPWWQDWQERLFVAVALLVLVLVLVLLFAPLGSKP